VGPVSRTQASLLLISITRTVGGNWARANSYWAAEAATLTGSNCPMAAATAAKARWAGRAPSRQLSSRSGQIIQAPAWRSNSPGIQ
jgi:hypothetical protein